VTAAGGTGATAVNSESHCQEISRGAVTMPVALEAMFQYANESESEVLTLIDSATAW